MAYRSKRYTRAELDQEARKLGLSPRRYRNKDLLVEALNRLASTDQSIVAPFKMSTCLGNPLTQGFTRQEADLYAQTLGFETVRYPNKRAVCLAIQEYLAAQQAPSPRAAAARPVSAKPVQAPVPRPATRPVARSPLPAPAPRPASDVNAVRVSAASSSAVPDLPFKLRRNSASPANDWRPFPLQAGANCGYQRGGLLGEGSYGQVYDASQRGKTYALKSVASANDSLEAEMLTEAYILAHARHPHVSRAYDIFFQCDERISTREPAIHYLLEKADGGSLRQWLATPHTTAEKLQVLQQIVSGLAFLHRHGVVHADIKPGNVLIHQGKALLADFSVSQRWVGIPLSREVQTVPWRAPEIVFREYGLASDMWAIGALMWDLLEGNVDDPLFRAYEEIDLLPTIINTIGKPANWPPPKHQAQYAELMLEQPLPRAAFTIKIPALRNDPQALAIWDLFNRCLVFDPARRITAAEFLQSPLFANLANPEGEWLTSTPGISLYPDKFSKILSDWLDKVRERERSPIATLALAIDLVERSLARLAQPPNKDLQLLGMAAYSLAARLTTQNAFTDREYVRIADKAYTVPQLLAAQAQICQVLQFQLWPDNWPVVCPDPALQEKVIRHYITNTLPVGLRTLYTSRRYRELCRHPLTVTLS
jgi:serine/threonine protein kinase